MAARSRRNNPGPRGPQKTVVNMMVLVLVLLMGLAVPGPAAGLRFLGVFPLPAHSHFIMFKALAEGLVGRGHEVVLFSPFPSERRVANLTEVDTSGGKASLVGTFTLDMVAPSSGGLSLPGAEYHHTMKIIQERAGNGLCRDVFSMPEFDRVLRGGFGRFDAVLTEIFGSDCWAAVAYKLGLPLIGLSSAPDVSWMHDRVGSIDNPAYINNVLSDLPPKMDFWQRAANTITTIYINHLFKTLFQDESDPLVREFFGPDVPPLHELVRNTSLVLVNRHVSIHSARPLVPNVVHVGGLHIKPPPGKLDPAVVRWMDGAEHGVIFFSLGSLIRAASMPAAMRDSLLAAFAKLPQRVLWKYEDESLAVPTNVRVSKWLSQMDVLNHPKTLLFITHGGLMGTLESLHSGVPLLGIPLFADQMSNIRLYMSMGIAEQLDHRSLTQESVLEKITTMTSNPRYRERARKVATLFRDRPRPAMDEAVWWVEYVVRNGGAPFLRSHGADLPLYQYLLLDVVALGVAVVAILVLALRLLVSALLPSPSRQEKKKVA